jgi:hypothetical protein
MKKSSAKGCSIKYKDPFCSTCKNYHPQHDDGYEYLDCMLFMKKKDGKKKF